MVTDEAFRNPTGKIFEWAIKAGILKTVFFTVVQWREGGGWSHDFGDERGRAGMQKRTGCAL